MGKMSGPQVGILVGDARNLVHYFSSMRRRFVSIITSPPYADLQDYGVPNQIGFGQTLKEYLADLRQVFEACAELSTDDATMWIVVGPIRRNGELLLLPNLILHEAKIAGWIGREMITWEKNKGLPFTGHGELRDVTEQIVLLSKSPHYRFDVEMLLDPAPRSVWWDRYPERYSPAGRRPTNLWRIPIPTQGSWRSGPSHACPFPYELTFRMLSLVTVEGEPVLDPFAGIGSVPAMANAMGRLGCGLELSPRYVDQYPMTLTASQAWWHVRSQEIESAAERKAIFRRTIMELRLLKYARILSNHLRKQDIPLRWVRVGDEIEQSKIPYKIIRAQFELVLAEPIAPAEVISFAEEKSQRRPLSKFGIEPRFRVALSHEPRPDGYWYPSGKFWRKGLQTFPDGASEPHVIAPFEPDIDSIRSWESKGRRDSAMETPGTD